MGFDVRGSCVDEDERHMHPLHLLFAASLLMSLTTSPLTLVTGATDGIGYQTALDLARRGHRIILHGRREAKLDASLRALREEVSGAHVETIRADFSSLEDVRRMGSDLVARHGKLDVLVKQRWRLHERAKREQRGDRDDDGGQSLRPFSLLTHLLLDLLGNSEGTGRVVNVSSIAHKGSLARSRGHRFGARVRPLWRLCDLQTRQRPLHCGVGQTTRAPGARRHSCMLFIPAWVSTKLLTQGFGMQGPDTLAKGAQTSVYSGPERGGRGPLSRLYYSSRANKLGPIHSPMTRTSQLGSMKRAQRRWGIEGLPAVS